MELQNRNKGFAVLFYLSKKNIPLSEKLNASESE
jgi:hypothetical protein